MKKHHAKSSENPPRLKLGVADPKKSPLVEPKSSVDLSAQTLEKNFHERRTRSRRLALRYSIEFVVTVFSESGPPIIGLTRDISASGLKLLAHHQFEPLLDIELDIENLGRFNGYIAWSSKREAGVALLLSPKQKDQLIDRLEESVEKDLAEYVVKDRRQARAHYGHQSPKIGTQADLYLKRKDKTLHACSLAGISQVGFDVVTNVKLQMGERISIGATQGAVVGRIANGFAVKYI